MAQITPLVQALQIRAAVNRGSLVKRLQVTKAVGKAVAQATQKL